MFGLLRFGEAQKEQKLFDALFASSQRVYDVVAGADMGQLLAGYNNNFAWGTLDLTGQTLTLSDGNAVPGGALYVGIISGLTIVSAIWLPTSPAMALIFTIERV